MSYGINLRTERARLNVSLRKFANAVGIHPTYLSKIELEQLPPPSGEVRHRIEEEITRLLKEQLGAKKEVLEQTKAEVFELQLDLISQFTDSYAQDPLWREQLTDHLRACADRLEKAARGITHQG